MVRLHCSGQSVGTGRQQQSCEACPGHHSVGHGWFSVRRLLHSLLRRTEEGLMVRELDAAWRHTQLSFREGTPTQHLRDSPLVSVPYGTPLADGRRLILSSSHSPTQPYSSLSQLPLSGVPVREPPGQRLPISQPALSRPTRGGAPVARTDCGGKAAECAPERNSNQDAQRSGIAALRR